MFKKIFCISAVVLFTQAGQAEDITVEGKFVLHGRCESIEVDSGSNVVDITDIKSTKTESYMYVNSPGATADDRCAVFLSMKNCVSKSGSFTIQLTNTDIGSMHIPPMVTDFTCKQN
jgi:hypothetical protein